MMILKGHNKLLVNILKIKNNVYDVLTNRVDNFDAVYIYIYFLKTLFFIN